MARNGWKWLEMAGRGQKWVQLVYRARHEWKIMLMAVNVCTLLDITGDGWKWLEMAVKCLEMAGNG